MRHHFIGKILVVLVSAAFLAGCSASAESRCLASRDITFNLLSPDTLLADCEAALAAAPDKADLQFAAARVIQKTGKIEQATALYRKASEAGNGRAFNNLAVLTPDAKTAFDLLERGHALGDAYSTNGLAMAYAKGLGVGADPVRAVELYRQAADKGHALAKYNLAMALQIGTGVPRDPDAARRMLREAAEGGVSQAQYYHGVVLIGGDGVKKDTGEGIKWLERAAAQGDVVAQGELALMLERGSVVKRDDARALQLLAAAAEQGFAPAELHLARRYMEGRGVAADEAKGRSLLVSAADHGDASAQYLVGMMYLQGTGVKSDKAKAEGYFARASNQGVVAALTQYAKLRPESERLEMIQYAAGRGEPEALYVLGLAVVQGTMGLAQDVLGGWAIVGKAAALNHGPAVIALAHEHWKGHVKMHNPARARALYRQLLNHPDPGFRESAANYLYEMDGGWQGEQNRKAMQDFITGAAAVFIFLGQIGAATGGGTDVPPASSSSTDLCSSAYEVYAWSGDDAHRRGYGCW